MDLQDAMQANAADARASREDAFTRLRVFLPSAPALTLGRRHHGLIKSMDLSDFAPEPRLASTLARARALGWPVLAADRGGEATVHLRGQVVAFVAVPAPRLAAQRLVASMLETAAKIAAQYSVQAKIRGGADAGLWTPDGAKLASIGLRWREGVFTHGLALNVAVDPRQAEGFTLCGHAHAGFSSLLPCDVSAGNQTTSSEPERPARQLKRAAELLTATLASALASGG